MKLKIPCGYKQFLKKLLNYRTIEIYTHFIYQGTRSIFKGLPQCSVLSPFNLYVKDVLKYVP